MNSDNIDIRSHKTTSAIDSIDIELTERCNNNCLHCCINRPMDDKISAAREMDTAFVKSILAQAAELGTLSVRFTGGEPLLRNDFKDLYLFARRLGMKVLLFTNARLLDDNLADLFARIPPLERIEITVYGMTPDSCRAVTRSSRAFDQTMRAIKLLKERKVPFILKSALIPQNAGDQAAIETLASQLTWMDGQPPSFSSTFDLRSRRDSPKKNSMIRKLRISPEAFVDRLRLRADAVFFNQMQQFCTKFMGAPGDTLFSCGAGRGGGCVDAYGMLQPCMSIRHSDLLYDLKTGSLKKGIRDFFPTIREMRTENSDYLQRCGRCFIKGLCGQCPGKSWSEHGNLDTPVEYQCDIAHAHAEFLGLLRPGEFAPEVVDPKARVTRLQETEYDKWAAERGISIALDQEQ